MKVTGMARPGRQAMFWQKLWCTAGTGRMVMRVCRAGLGLDGRETALHAGHTYTHKPFCALVFLVLFGTCLAAARTWMVSATTEPSGTPDTRGPAPWPVAGSTTCSSGDRQLRRSLTHACSSSSTPPARMCLPPPHVFTASAHTHTHTHTHTQTHTHTYIHIRTHLHCRLHV